MVSPPLQGVTWGQVQRHLQETGQIFWRPSLKEKREAARRSAGLRPPDGKKMLASFCLILICKHNICKLAI